MGLLRTRRGFLVVLAAVAAAVTLASAAELPKGFRLEPVIPSGLTEPSSLAATPDGRILITERTTGNLRVVQGGELQAAALCSVSVTSTGEGGLLGVAVHPNFAVNGWVYLYYTDSATSLNKVARFAVSGGTCSGPTDILANLGAGPSFLNNGGGIAFGPDGKLYVATGDVESSSNGQNGATLFGKVLRVNDNGTVPADNPTPGSLVYSLGVRSGGGVAVNAAGNVYMTDRGKDPSVYDELNSVRPAGNLGWDPRTGPSGGVYDDPMVWASPVKGMRGLDVYGAQAFPNLAADGKDNDKDRLGADLFPGTWRTDENARGECLGGANTGLPCTTAADCSTARQCQVGPFVFTEVVSCWMADEMNEYCPGGVPSGDDACGASSPTQPARGVDEPDEAFLNNLFFAQSSGKTIERAVLKPSDLTQLNVAQTFLNSNALADCPSGWTDVLGGNDGWLYAVATNTGGAAGGLYRVIYDVTPGPREVSGGSSHFPLRVNKGAAAGDLDILWEDLRLDSSQPRDTGTEPARPAREYTIWQGTLGSFYSHNPAVGFTATPGTTVNEAYRKATVNVGTSSGNLYFLVSGRADNLEGTLGRRTNGTERPGYAVTDLCQTIGYHEGPSWSLWKCGKDFTLQDEYGETHSLSEFRGQPVVLDFSAVWCGPCNTEADTIETDLYQPYKDRGVMVLTVLMDSDNSYCAWRDRPNPAECRKWGDRTGSTNDHTFPCLADPNPPAGQPQEAWPLYDAFNAVPTNLVLDSGMRVVYTGGGYSKTTIQGKLDKLVGVTDACLQ